VTKEMLVKLRKATDNAIGVVETGERRGLVNWADLSCRQAAWVSTDQGDSYAEVKIEEASPDASEFQEAIRAELERSGWPSIEVVTEW